MKYDIILGNSIGDLVEKVNKVTKDGWGLQGMPFNYGGSIAQAVYKAEEPDFEAMMS